MSPNICELLTNGIVTCFLTNQYGVPVNPFAPDSLVCQELQGPQGRKDVLVTLADGQEAILQKVKIRKAGFIVVEIVDGIDKCLSNPIPFTAVESALLCAPEGTEVVCEVIDFNCSAQVNCQHGLYQSVEIFLDICQSLEVVTDTNITLSGHLCKPREHLNSLSCPQSSMTMTSQCDLLISPQQLANFPNSNFPPLIKDSSALAPFQHETFCVHTKKVYDWVVQQSVIQIRKNANEAPIVCGVCTLGLFVPAVTVCERVITGNVVCDGNRVSGAAVFFSAAPDIVFFSPEPAITDANGNFTTTVIVPPGTNPTPIHITATTTLNDQEVSTTLPTIARCLTEPCLLFLFGPDSIECDGLVSGRVRCGNTPIEGVEVTLSSNPPILTFDPNPAPTGSLGDYFSGVTVPSGTPPTNVEITASATVDGQLLTETMIVNVQCTKTCILTLTSNPIITCSGELTGTIACDGEPVAGALIYFSTFPAVGSFSPNPAISDVNGHFTTTLTIPENTPLISIAITATTTISGQSVETSIGVQVECPVVECPCKFRLGVGGGAAPTTVQITEQGTPSSIEGTINVTAVQCFTASPMCNPAVDNFNIAFGDGGTTINFIVGRRIDIQCIDNNFARVHGTARATGNVFSGIFDVTIEVSINSFNIGTWSIFADDFMGNTFSTTFSAPMSPITFIGDCNQTP